MGMPQLHSIVSRKVGCVIENYYTVVDGLEGINGIQIVLRRQCGYSPTAANFERGPILGKKGTHHHGEKDLVGETS